MTPAAAAETASLDNAVVVPGEVAENTTDATTEPGSEPGAPEPARAGAAPPESPALSEASSVPAITRRRLAPHRADPQAYLWSWVATALVTLIAGAIRLVNLDQPKGKIFDEVYYANEGWSMVQHGVEWNLDENVAKYVVHPPLGKWLIALGERLFGFNEFGWRIAAAVAGTLAVLILIRVARMMFHSTVLACAAGLLMALDGMQFVLSRTALLDIFLMFFVLAAFAALVADRDARRRRWLRALEAGLDPGRPGKPLRPGSAVPWWRLLAAVLMGCAISVKWSALFFLPVMALLVLFWEAGARKSAGARHPWLDALRVDVVGWLSLCAVLIGLTYVASWSGWFLTDGGYFRHWLRDTGQPEPAILGALQNLWHYHEEAFKFHSTLQAKHQYQSWPWQWLLLGRPVAFHWADPGGCGAPSCASEVLLLGTPVLWWSMIPALGALTWLGIARRDWRAGAIWMGIAAGLLPWFFYALQGRTMFYFYALPAEPFLVLAIVYVLGAIMSPARGAPDESRRLIGAVIVGAYVLLVAACFAWYYPIYVGQTIPYADWHMRMLLDGRWI